MTSSTALPQSLSQDIQLNDPNTTCRAIVFTIAGHWLALPLAAVLKVVPAAAIGKQDPLQPLIYLDNKPILRLNLHECLSSIPGNSAVNDVKLPSQPGQFFLMVGLQAQISWAIPVDEAPNLMELPLSAIHLLPSVYRQSIQNIAYHSAVLVNKLANGSTNQTVQQTILLLDLQQAAQLTERSLPQSSNVEKTDWDLSF
jgi:hypothetical protein